MGKFKVGDRVRYVGGGVLQSDYLVGKDGVVVESGTWPCVDFDGYGQRGGLLPENLALLPVAEQQAGPIRTVTRREIVPGVYGPVKIGEWVATPPRIDMAAGKITVEDKIKVGLIPSCLSGGELREAARIFNEIADVLEEDA